MKVSRHSGAGCLAGGAVRFGLALCLLAILFGAGLRADGGEPDDVSCADGGTQTDGVAVDLAIDALWHLSPPISDRLGLAFPNNRAEDYPLIASMGMGVVRVSAAWKRVERRLGQYDFSGLDYRILALDTLGIETFLTFESDHPRRAWYTDQVGNGMPADLRDWARFVGAVVERYDGDGQEDAPGLTRPVRYIQAGNEFLSDRNRSGGWAGSDAGLIDYINAAYTAAKAANPQVVFVLGGIAAFNMDAVLLDAERADFTVQQNWSDTSRTVITRADLDTPEWRKMIDNRFYPVLAGASYDMADVHLYGPEDRDVARLTYIRSLTDKPLLSSECGGPTTDYGTIYSGHRHYVSVLERTLSMLANNGRFCLWFGLSEALTTSHSNRQTPLYTADLEPKPGVDAMRLLAALLADGGAVTQPAPRLFMVQTDAGPACIALGVEAKRALATTCPAPANAICVTDAQGQQASLVPTATINAACPDNAVALTGPGLTYSLLRNRTP